MKDDPGEEEGKGWGGYIVWTGPGMGRGEVPGINCIEVVFSIASPCYSRNRIERQMSGKAGCRLLDGTVPEGTSSP